MIGLEAYGVNVAAVLKGAVLGGCAALKAASCLHLDIPRERRCCDPMSLLLKLRYWELLKINLTIHFAY